jgi:hypothetical protein
MKLDDKNARSPHYGHGGFRDEIRTFFSISPASFDFRRIPAPYSPYSTTNNWPGCSANRLGKCPDNDVLTCVFSPANPKLICAKATLGIVSGAIIYNG